MSRPQRIILCTTNGKIFHSIKEAAETLYVTPQAISHVLRGRAPHASGYVFEYADHLQEGESQQVKILNYLKKHGSITRIEAEALNIHCLASRICELRRAGHDITSIYTTRKKVTEYIYKEDI